MQFKFYFSFTRKNLNKLKHFGIFYGYEKLIKNENFLDYGGDILALNKFMFIIIIIIYYIILFFDWICNHLSDC